MAVNGQSYTTTYAYAYDSQSRIDRLTYPASGLVLKHVYNANGFLTELRNNADNSPFWTLVAMDAKGDVDPTAVWQRRVDRATIRSRDQLPATYPVELQRRDGAGI